MNYRHATIDDIQQIAELHALSWRNSYRGMLSDDFLDREVSDNRLAVWKSRLETPNVEQFVLVAEENKRIDGFVCVFPRHHDKWGALLDNLHVRQERQGQGLGKDLMSRTGSWMQTHHPDSALYLWVFDANQQAIRFYERLGGQLVGEKREAKFGNKPVRALRYAWHDSRQLIYSY